MTRLHLYVLFIYWCCQAFPLVTRAAEGHGSSWPACSISAPDLSAGSPDAAQAQQIARITLPSSPSGCSLVFASGAGAEAAGAKAQRLAPGALIAGGFLVLQRACASGVMHIISSCVFTDTVSLSKTWWSESFSQHLITQQSVPHSSHNQCSHSHA